MAPNITLLAGAPFRTDLNWDEQQLISSLGPEFERIVDYPNAYVGIKLPDTGSSQSKAKWRVIVSRIDPREHDKNESASLTSSREESIVIVRDFADPNQKAPQPIPRISCSPQQVQHDSAVSLSTPKPVDSQIERTATDQREEDVTVFFDTNLHQQHHKSGQETSSQTPQPDIDSDKLESPQDRHAEYLDYSLAVYEESQPAEIPTDNEDDTLIDDDSLVSHGSTQLTYDNSAESIGLLDSNHSEIIVDLLTPPTSLGALPKVNDLNRIYPQTVTANLIVGVISKQDARTIRTKKNSRLMTLVELLVGDKSGKTLTVTVWVRPNQQSDSLDPFRQRDKNETSLLDTLNDVRNRDILLIRNVALSTYNGIVRGQTLHPSAKTRTSIVIAGRNGRRHPHVSFQGPYEGEAISMATDVENWMQAYLPAAFVDHVGKKQAPTDGDDDYDEVNGEESLVELPPDTPR